MSKRCNVCQQRWSNEDVDSDNICRYCWDRHVEDWINGDDDDAEKPR